MLVCKDLSDCRLFSPYYAVSPRHFQKVYSMESFIILWDDVGLIITEFKTGYSGIDLPVWETLKIKY